MGMKEPRGKAMKIGGTISSPKDVDQYSKMGNAATSAKNNVTSDLNIGNSSMPKDKSSGKAKVY